MAAGSFGYWKAQGRWVPDRPATASQRRRNGVATA
eukprot:CAMPEP_0174897696 /NCGR_PEP_ID=MMETSP0167-20121228/15988_1 /TAXON_ID=38298 /ORGANISM="Rhodella maculata, Strain CCMP736" /LENGTH=34 /DNA_ID= /DNA_START= /DNA_END= /DNA_ORIENTATION=